MPVVTKTNDIKYSLLKLDVLFIIKLLPPDLKTQIIYIDLRTVILLYLFCLRNFK